MDTRVSTQSIYQDAILDHQRISDQLTSLQAQASTGQKFSHISDDPSAAMEVLSNTDQDQLLTTHLANIQSATTALNTSVSALQQVSNIMAQAKSLAIQASNSGNDGTALTALAQQLNGLINNLLSAANTQNNGVYVFGGASADKQPYVVAQTDSAGNPTTISYEASSTDASTTIANNQQVPIYYAGSEVFQAQGSQPAVFSGNTGAQAGTGADSATGQDTLTLQHTATTFAAGSGVQAGASSAQGDTILGHAGAHNLTITDTSGDGSAGTISLDGGPPVAFTNTDTDLKVTNANGDIVYLDTSAITPGFNGNVAITSTGTMSVDGGATSAPITFGNNQAVTDGKTGAVTFVNTSQVQRTGSETIEHPGSYDAFQALIALRDDLNNTQGLSEADQMQAISARIADVDSASTQVQSALGEQSATLQSLSALQSQFQSLQLSTQENISNVGGADVTSLVVQVQSYEQMLQVSLEAFARISSTSLLTYLSNVY